MNDKWFEMFACLKKYSKKFGHTGIADGKKFDGLNVGTWADHQRRGKNKLSRHKIKLLEALPKWSWNVLEDQWNEGFACLKKYSKKYGHTRIEVGKKFDGFNLGKWIAHQRMEKNKLSPHRIKLLEALPKWSWKVLEDQWNEGFAYLKKYSEKYGHSRIALKKKFDGFNLGSWISCQRKKGKNKLNPKRVQLLEALPKWSWDVQEDQWNEAFENLKKYSKKYGHSRIAHDKKFDGFNLGKWVAHQRNGKNKLSTYKIKLLESLPRWTWDALEDKWNENFACLKKYSKKYGHSRIAKGKKFDGFNLGKWAINQRKCKNKLSTARIKLLEALPKWSWNLLEDQWNEAFESLKKYSKKYGHSRIANGEKFDGFNLGGWVAYQRRGKNKLSPNRIKLLEILPQWSWNVQEDQWNEGFAYLKKYSKKYGSTRIADRKKFDGYNLGKWAAHQRSGKNKLSTNKIKLLEAIPNWSWNVQEDQWNEAFESLKKYSKKYGHSRIAVGKKFDEFNLGGWVANQRRSKNKLSLNKIKLLEVLPQWSWSVHEDQWNEAFESLKKYSQKYGHSRIADGKKFDGFNIGKWVAHQRSEKKQKKLSKERIKLLESLPGWCWAAKKQIKE